MTIERIDPLELDEETADGIATLINAADDSDGVDVPPAIGSGVLGETRHGGQDRPVDALWVARGDDGKPVAAAQLETTEFDNPDLAFVFCHVHPTSRRRGIGTVLLDAQIAEARARGRTSLMTFQVRGTPAQQLLESRGFTSGMRTAQRRLDLPTLDYGRVATLFAGAEGAAHDYELIRLDGVAPEDWLPDLVAVHEAINDAPMDDIAMEPEAFPVERIQSWERAMAKRHQHVYRLLVRRRDTGEWAGHTILVVDDTRPGVANQEDTSVVVSHRGHRLGMLLKSAMLLWMRDVEPGLTTIDTWNAESNTHMIAVNDELGCRVANRGVGMQLALAEHA